MGKTRGNEWPVRLDPFILSTVHLSEVITGERKGKVMANITVQPWNPELSVERLYAAAKFTLL